MALIHILGLLFVCIVALALYFLPTLIAVSLNKASTGWIFLLNLFLGGTGLGWFAALIWAIVGARG